MRIIEQAIEEHRFEELDSETRTQTWEKFAASAAGKSVWIFGLGEAADYFFEKYGKNYSIAGVVDNDKGKQGQKISEYIGSNMLPPDMTVSVPSVLDCMEKNNILVLVCSVRYYNEIARQLKAMGIKRPFSFFAMEINERKDMADKPKADWEFSYVRDCSRLPIQHNKILLARDECGGHGKQILLRLAGLGLEIDLVWITDNDGENLPSSIRLIKPSNKRTYIKELETAHIWLFGDMIPEFAQKRAGQIYIQIKHWSSLTLKKFYMDLHNYLAVPSIKQYYAHNNEAMDYVFVGSKFDEDSCRSGFAFNGECVYVGSPRSDVLFRDGVREMVMGKLHINDEFHILLYAPTFRARNNHTVIGRMPKLDLDFYRLRTALQSRFGGDWCILLRIHPDVAMESIGVDLPNFVENVSFYPDSQELVAASDAMVSDYSSIMFEPAFVKKPVFRYASDLEDYIGKERELLLDYYALPFPLASSNEELEQCIWNFDKADYQEKLRKMFSVYDVHEDGKASERAAQFILGLL